MQMQLDSKIEILKSPLNFTGGKHKLLPQLLPLFPQDISTFVDLFCGGCNVAINITAKKIICNDIDSKLIGLLSFIKSNSYEDFFSNIQKVIKDYNLSNSYLNGYSFYNCNSRNGLGNFNKRGYLNLRQAFNSLLNTDENYFLFLYHSYLY